MHRNEEAIEWADQRHRESDGDGGGNDGGGDVQQAAEDAAVRTSDGEANKGGIGLGTGRYTRGQGGTYVV